MKIISNLEDGSVSFLYELFHSIIDFKSSQVIILRKKVEKNSPFGKFLRMVLMNVRRMSYPQVHYLYRQLCTYVGEFVRSRKKSVGIIPSEQIPRTPSSSSTTPTSSSTVKDDSSSSGTPNTSSTAPITVLQDVWPSSVGTSKPFKTNTKPSQQPNPYKFRGLEIFQRMIDRGRKNSSGLDYFSQYTTEYKRATGKWNLAQERDLQKSLEEKKRRVALAIEARKSLRNLWQPNPLLRTASQASLDNSGDIDTSSGGVGGRPAAKRRSGGRPNIVPALRTMPPRSPRKGRPPPLIQQELTPLSERDDGYFPSDDEEIMGPPSTPPIPMTPKSPRSKSKVKTPKKSPSYIGPPYSDSSPTSSSPTVLESSSRSSVERQLAKELPASKRWEQVKWWSRKQIEKALKELATELLNTSKYSYSPREISTFVEMIIQNPSAQILLSQIVNLNTLCLKN